MKKKVVKFEDAIKEIIDLTKEPEEEWYKNKDSVKLLETKLEDLSEVSKSLNPHIYEKSICSIANNTKFRNNLSKNSNAYSRSSSNCFVNSNLIFSILRTIPVLLKREDLKMSIPHLI